MPGSYSLDLSSLRNLFPFRSQEESIATLRQEFAPYYEQHLAPLVAEFEASRQSACALSASRKTTAYFATVPLMTAAACVAYYSQFSEEGIKTALTLLLFGIMGLSAWVLAPVARYQKSIKSRIFPIIFHYIGEDFGFLPDSPLSIADLEPSGLIPSHTQSSVEDYVKGSHQEVNIELMEAHLSVKTKNSSRTVFKGLFVRLGMNKRFSGKTIVRKDSTPIGNFLSGLTTKLERVTLEDPIFERQFEVYSNDQVEARYLLTTSFMERLLELSALYDNKIECCFYDDNLLLKIPSPRNFFEPGSAYKPVTFIHDINTIIDEMKVIFHIIKVLKLNIKTGL